MIFKTGKTESRPKSTKPNDKVVTPAYAISKGVDMIHVQGAGGTASVLAGSTEIRSASDRGRLVLVSAGGMHALREFDAGLIERSYTFSIPRSLREKIAQTGTASPQTTVLAVQ